MGKHNEDDKNDKKLSENEATDNNVSQEEGSIPMPELDFSTFILSLSTSVLYNLGDAEAPGTNKIEKNIPLARQTIDIIALLKEKTKGNLTKDEGELIENILYELRIRYLKEIQ